MDGRRLVRSNCTFRETWTATSGDSTGRNSPSAEPIELKLGERVRFVLINDTMMEHPIHLHGLWSELENGHGEFNPYKHTITVKPAERVSYLVSADTPGMGLSLPSALSHGSRNVSYRGGSHECPGEIRLLRS